VGAEKNKAKNLVEAETRTEKWAAGATNAIPDVKGKIIEYIWRLKREGYAESTITTYSYILKAFIKEQVNLYDPDAVKDFIARKETWGAARRNNVVKAYNLFLGMEGLSWQPPRYKAPQKLPFIPTEKEIDDLIAGCNKNMSAYLHLLKETAARRGEAFNLKWTEIDLINRTVRITPEKGSRPRIFKISENLARKLGSLPRKTETLFPYKNVYYLDKSFRKQRKRIVKKLENPRLKQIHFHTLRHWKATMEYHRTKDILHVMQVLGHRKIENTLLYVQLVKAIFQDVDDEYVCKVAKNVDEASSLVEVGFEYVTGEYEDGGKLFRKKKSYYH
jgi:integrase